MADGADSSAGPRGDSSARLATVYDRLRRAAQAQLARGGDARTLQATALVHEAWIKLAQGGQPLPEDPDHLLALFIRTMRQVVIDEHRKRARGRHGGGKRPISLDAVAPAADPSFSLDDVDVEALNRAMDRFEREEPGQRDKLLALQLSIFMGFTVEQIADVLGVDPRTVQRYIRAARAWLFDALSGDP